MGPLFRVKPFPHNIFLFDRNRILKSDNNTDFFSFAQVTLEESPDESFFNVSAQQCWEMVLQRVKDTSTSLSLPISPQFESINGLQMFGFLSPSIVQVKNLKPIPVLPHSKPIRDLCSLTQLNPSLQAIEALDPNHRLVEYWNHKTSSDSKDHFISSSCSVSLTKGKLFGVDLM